MTTQQVADRLGISTNRVGEFARAGRLPMLRLGYAHRYRPADVEAFARIPRPSGVHLAPGRRGGGPPKGNFNALGNATGLTRGGKRLQPFRRVLPPKSRRIFDVAVIAAARASGGDTPHQRYIERYRAIALVVATSGAAWNAPAVTRVEQHKNLVVALKPWLEQVGITPDGDPVFDLHDKTASS